MALVESITFDDENIGSAVASAPLASPRTSDDTAFLDRLRASDEAAFGILVDRYSTDIYSVLYRLTQGAEEAADLTQDTFLRALRSIKAFRGDSELKTWLIRIAINESRNRFRWWKRRKRGSTVSLDAAIGETSLTLSDTIADRSISPEQAALDRERELALQAAIAELATVYREAIVLCDIEGLTYEETAVALGTNIGTVKSRISRGRQELRRSLKDL
jgi:RNA polymerase sigma-70 factor (ECF subfamily)